MKKKLPIQRTPYMHTYTQHGFFHAITCTDDKVCLNEKDTVAEIIVRDYEKYEWQEQKDQLRYVLDTDGKLCFFANRWNTGMNMAFWRECKVCDELTLRIEKQLYSNAWSAISIFLIKASENNPIDFDAPKISVGRFEKDGVFYSSEPKVHHRINAGRRAPVEIKLVRENEEVFMECAEDQGVSKRFLICQLEQQDECRIGFSVNLGNNAYYEWTFSNYVQLFARPGSIIPVDYMVNLHKDWCVHTTNPLVDYHRIKKENLNILKLSCLEYIKLQIDLDNYVETEINDNLNFGMLDEEGGKYFHQNLIYGYDDEKGCLYTLFYYQGKVAESEISYDDFESERNQGGSDNLYMMHYNPCSEHFALYPDRLVQLFREYRDGVNISMYEPFFRDGFMIGNSVFQYFALGDGREKFYSDVRVLYLLYERAACNQDRIEYLNARGLLSENAYQNLKEIINEEVNELRYVKNAFIKRHIKGMLQLGDFDDNMRRAAYLEKRFVDQFIELLG